MSKELELLNEWRELLRKQRDIVEQRGDGDRFDGAVGILVTKDPLALEFQEANRRIWAIRTELFGYELLFHCM